MDTIKAIVPCPEHADNVKTCLTLELTGHTGATVIELTAMRIPTSLPEYENRDQLLAVELADAWVAFRKGL